MVNWVGWGKKTEVFGDGAALRTALRWRHQRQTQMDMKYKMYTSIRLYASSLHFLPNKFFSENEKYKNIFKAFFLPLHVSFFSSIP